MSNISETILVLLAWAVILAGLTWAYIARKNRHDAQERQIELWAKALEVIVTQRAEFYSQLEEFYTHRYGYDKEDNLFRKLSKPKHDSAPHLRAGKEEEDE